MEDDIGKLPKLCRNLTEKHLPAWSFSLLSLALAVALGIPFPQSVWERAGEFYMERNRGALTVCTIDLAAAAYSPWMIHLFKYWLQKLSVPPQITFLLSHFSSGDLQANKQGLPGSCSLSYLPVIGQCDFAGVIVQHSTKKATKPGFDLPALCRTVSTNKDILFMGYLGWQDLWDLSHPSLSGYVTAWCSKVPISPGVMSSPSSALFLLWLLFLYETRHTLPHSLLETTI